MWSRSVYVAEDGLPWTTVGLRADFVFVLFMHGFSVDGIRSTMFDGQDISARVVEDCIRWGLATKAGGAK